MSKPICKAEAKWDIWRDDRGRKRFTPWQKRQMNKAKRRFLCNFLYP